MGPLPMDRNGLLNMGDRIFAPVMHDGFPFPFINAVPVEHPPIIYDVPLTTRQLADCYWRVQSWNVTATRTTTFNGHELPFESYDFELFSTVGRQQDLILGGYFLGDTINPSTGVHLTGSLDFSTASKVDTNSFLWWGFAVDIGNQGGGGSIYDGFSWYPQLNVGNQTISNTGSLTLPDGTSLEMDIQMGIPPVEIPPYPTLTVVASMSISPGFYW